MTNSNYNRNPSGIGGWKKGQSGNPGGRSNYGLTEMMREAAPDVIKTLKIMAENKDWFYPRAIQLRAMEIILDRGYGKVKDIQEEKTDIQEMTLPEMKAYLVKYLKSREESQKLDNSIQENVEEKLENQTQKRKKASRKALPHNKPESMSV